MKKVCLIGNPNAGKTSLFNGFTGCQECVGNWAGATATCCQALSCSTIGGDQYRLLDTPGCYQLSLGLPMSDHPQAEVMQLLESGDIDLIINVIDISQLSRQLFLTSQLAETGIPMLVVLNRIDLCQQSQEKVNEKKLSQILGCPVIKASSKTGWGMRNLKQAIMNALNHSNKGVVSTQKRWVFYPDALEDQLASMLSDHHKPSVLARLNELVLATKSTPLPSFSLKHGFKQLLNQDMPSLEALIACKRREVILSLSGSIINHRQLTSQNTGRIDRWLLHSVWGLPLFLCMILLVFGLSMGLGLYGQTVLEPLWIWLCVDVPSFIINHMFNAGWMSDYWREGPGLGMVTTLGFLPLMTTVFFGLYWLEESGYMTRSAIILDRFLNRLQLPGESLIALVLGFGCNVPGIAATDPCKNKQDKLVVIMMMPFMSCSARLVIFSVFCACFFGNSGSLVLFGLYALGIAVALLTGLLVRSLGGEGKGKPVAIIELPAYQWPSTRQGLTLAFTKAKSFVVDAMKAIVPVCIVLSLLSHLDSHGQWLEASQVNESLLAGISQWFLTTLSPLDMPEHAWPLILSLLMGLVAKEAVLGTLGFFYGEVDGLDAGLTLVQILYSRLGDTVEALSKGVNFFLPGAEQAGLLPGLTEALQDSHQVMAYLIFTLLYFPCMSTLVAMAKRIGRFHAGLSVLWSFFVAYMGVFLYRLTIYHPLWLIVILGLVWLVMLNTAQLKSLLSMALRQIKDWLRKTEPMKLKHGKSLN